MAAKGQRGFSIKELNVQFPKVRQWLWPRGGIETWVAESAP